MIRNFHEVRPNLWRGGKLSLRNVILLHKKFNIQTIISLDKHSAALIDPMCQQLGIKHHILTIHPADISSLKSLLSHNIHELVQDDVPTYIHCRHGRDRTGLFVALVRCLLDDWDCKDALKEAKHLGFGTGLSMRVEKFYTKLINKACQHEHEDANNAYDMLSNLLDFNAQYKDYTLDEASSPSWAPYADAQVRTYPYANIEQYVDTEGPTRETYDLSGIDVGNKMTQIPAVGVYDQNTQITNMVGPSLVGGGFV